MIFIDRIKISGFISFENFNIKLKQVENIIVGTNGAGKTSFIELVNLAMSSDFEHLDKYITFSNNKQYIEIHLKFYEDDLKLLNKLFILFFVHKYVYESNSNPNINYDMMIEIASLFNLFGEGLIILCEYNNGTINRKLLTPSCECENVTNILNQNHWGNSKCLIKDLHCIFGEYIKAKQYIDSISENPLQLSNLLQELSKNYKGLLKFCVDLGIIETNNCNVELNNENYEIQKNKIEELIRLFTNDEKIDQQQKSNIVIKKLFDKEIMCNEILSLIRNHLENNFENRDDIKRFIESADNNIYGNILCKHIESLVSCVQLYEPIHNYDIFEELCKYENIKFYNGKHHTNNIINISTALYDLFLEINVGYETRYNVHGLKNDDPKVFQKLQKDFNLITGKQFDVFLENENNVIDYGYYIISEEHKDKYRCSYGERELIEFIYNYHNEDTHITIIDEPC